MAQRTIDQKQHDRGAQDVELLACPLCDALTPKPEINEGQVVICRRCHSSLFAKKRNSLQRTLALSIAGLLLLIPAVTLPVIGLSTLGLFNQTTLIETLLLLIDDGFYFISGCFFLFAVAIPVSRLLVVCYVVVQIMRQQVTQQLVTLFRCYRQLEPWAMLHVYVLGLVVSMYKLVSLAELNVGLGLLSLGLLLICSTLVSVTLDEALFWRKLEGGLVTGNR